jgi:hypothetical protein
VRDRRHTSDLISRSGLHEACRDSAPPKDPSSQAWPPPTIQTSHCVGLLDWVGGFVGGPRLQIEAFLTSVAQCRRTLPILGPASPVSEMMTLSDQVQEQRSCDFSYLRQLQLGTCYDVDDKITRRSDPMPSDHLERQPSQRYKCRFKFTDETSKVLSFREVCTLYPHVAHVIERHAPCPPSVTFFIAWDEDTTIAIPCASILEHCYDVGSNRLAQFLMSPQREQFAREDVAFDGFRYIRTSPFRSERIYWARAQRYLRRAEHELAQLLPRAAAYHRRCGGFLPILIRPPFCGSVSIAGKAITDSDGKRTVAVITSDLSFGPACDTQPVRGFSTRLSFAPYVSRYGVTLPAAGISIYWKGSIDDDVFEPRYFAPISKMVLEGLQCGLVRIEKEEPLTFGDLVTLQEWCLRRLRR